VWGDEDVTSLIASIAKGFPVGALLTLENGGEVKFKPRLLNGVKAILGCRMSSCLTATTTDIALPVHVCEDACPYAHFK